MFTVCLKRREIFGSNNKVFEKIVSSRKTYIIFFVFCHLKTLKIEYNVIPFEIVLYIFNERIVNMPTKLILYLNLKTVLLKDNINMKVAFL